MNISDKNHNNQPSIQQKALGVAVGACIGLSPLAYSLKYSYTPIPDKKLIKMREKQTIKFPNFDTFENISKYANDILLKTGLKNKGVKIQIDTPKNLIIKPLAQDASLIKRLRYIKGTNRRKILANGLNACFYRTENKIHINNETLFTTVFHEIGHAINYNNTKIMKSFQKLRELTKRSSKYIVPLCLLVGLFGNKEQSKKEKPDRKNFVTSITHFMHNNAATIAFALGLPTLIEEGAASIKGIRLAKPYLNSLQHNTHIRMLALYSWGGYLMNAILNSGAVALGIFIKDKIVSYKKSD